MHRLRRQYCKNISVVRVEAGKSLEYIPWNDSDDTAPTESDTTAVEQTHIEPIGASLDLGKNLSIMLRDACRQGFAPFLSLRGWPSV